MPTGEADERGFTYVGLLLFVAIMSASLAGTGVLYGTVTQREKEKQLLFVGDQFRRAISQYYEKAPGGVKRYPQSLDDLLRDDRYVDVQRYLRRVYIDPITGSAEWGLVRAVDGGIVGVHSLSEETPMKTANFPADYEAFSGKVRYADWTFAYTTAAPARPEESGHEENAE